MPRFAMPGRRRTARISAVAVALAAVPLLGLSASAADTATITPFADCITTSATTGDITAYFGYDVTGPARTFPIGDTNQLFPTSPNAGQPTVFDTGGHTRVFSVTFDPTIIPIVAWILDGQEADAGAQSPVCSSGVTTPATLITTAGATLTGVVVPGGEDTTYTFDYGTTTALGSSTSLTDAGSGGEPVLVQSAVQGLTPNTTYYFRIDTTNGDFSSAGQVQQFTTPAAATTTPPAATPLGVTTTALPEGKVQKSYKAALTAKGGSGSYTWSVTCGSLPKGLKLDRKTGVISGTPKQEGTSHLVVQVSDSGKPHAQKADKSLTLKIDRRK